jgi:hypothetical protein
MPRARARPELGAVVFRKSRASQGGNDVGFLEILPLKQQRIAGDLGERISETVAEIQPGRVTPFSEIVEGLARDVRLLYGERLNDDASPAEKHIALERDFRPGLAFDDYGDFEKAPGTDETTTGIMDEPRVSVGVGFSEPTANSAEAPGSSWKAVFVVEECGMIQAGPLHVGGRALTDGEQFFDGGFIAAALKTIVAFTEGFRDGARQGFPGLLGDRLGEPMGPRVLDIETHRASVLL